MPKLVTKLVLYHVSLLGILLGCLYAFPQVEPYLPVGGLYEFGQHALSFEEVIETGRAEAVDERAYAGVARLAFALVVSISLIATQLVMLPIAWVYKVTHPGKKVDRYVAETLFLLPIVITAIVMIIKGSIALAFGLAGIVAGVQYRNRLKRPSDAAFLFAAIAVGLASGIQAIGIGIVMSLWFCVTIVVIRHRFSPAENPSSKQL